MTSRRRNLALSALLVTVVFVSACSRSGSDGSSHGTGSSSQAAADTFYFTGNGDVDSLFAAANYTLEAWRAGERTIPRFYLSRVPSRWRQRVAAAMPVVEKKRVFFFAYAPLVLEVNEAILVDRERLLALSAGKSRDGVDDDWLRELARRYRIDVLESEHLPEEVFDRLLRRVDVVPPSLALAQAAIESGWSTSRFSDVGNALFGQWTWGEDGITPQQQREGMGDYKIKAFPSPRESIAAYMHNLNTHRSYAGFRRDRARLRAGGEALTGSALAPTLTSYSERGEEYVADILSVIRVNGIEDTDVCRLRDMRPVLLVPVGPGSD